MSDEVVTSHDFNEALRDTAMLADVSIGKWSAEKADAKLMDQIKTDNGAHGKVGRAIKNLLAGNDTEYKNTCSAFDAVRTTHYQLTLPWSADPHTTRTSGPRLLSNVLFMRYLDAMSKRKAEAMKALDVFIADYPRAMQQALVNLGTMATVADYPDEVRIRAAFHASFTFVPLPAGSQFRGLPDHFIDKLAQTLEDRQRVVAAKAVTAVWVAAHDRVSRCARALSDPEGRLHASTLEHIAELAGLIPAWNITNDERLTEVAEDCGDIAKAASLKELRNQPLVRKHVATLASELQIKMERWGVCQTETC